VTYTFWSLQFSVACEMTQEGNGDILFTGRELY